MEVPGSSELGEGAPRQQCLYPPKTEGKGEALCLPKADRAAMECLLPSVRCPLVRALVPSRGRQLLCPSRGKTTAATSTKGTKSSWVDTEWPQHCDLERDTHLD